MGRHLDILVYLSYLSNQLRLNIFKNISGISFTSSNGWALTPLVGSMLSLVIILPKWHYIRKTKTYIGMVPVISPICFKCVFYRVFRYNYWCLKRNSSPILKTSIGFWSWYRSSAVSPQVTKAINMAVNCHYLSTRPAVTSPAAEHHCPLAGTKLYCFGDRGTCV